MIRWHLVPVVIAAGLALFACLSTFGQDATPQEEEELRRLLRNLSDRGEYARLLAEANRALATHSESPSGWRYKAYALHRLGRRSDAIAAYRRTTEIAPRNWWAHMNLADLLTQERRWPEAEQAARAAINIYPTHWAPRETLLRVLKTKRDYFAAIAVAEEALADGVSRSLCHQELAYLHWVLLHPEKSREHWVKASGFGGQEMVIDHGLMLLDWEEKPTGTRKEKEEIARRRMGSGVEWIFDLEGLEVHTRVGPRLPAGFDRTVRGLVREQAKFFGIKGEWPIEVRLHLSRTQEEHEVNRRREFPQGATGRGFLIERAYGRPRGAPRRRFENPRLEIYICWASRGLVQSLSHELAHAMLRMRVPDSRFLPAWFDEGVATYLEFVTYDDGTQAAGEVRYDLLHELQTALSADRALGWKAMLLAQRYEFTGPDARARYAQSWSMVHFLVQGMGRGGEKLLRSYLDTLADPRQAGKIRFGLVYGEDYRQTETDWSRHVIMLRNR